MSKQKLFHIIIGGRERIKINKVSSWGGVFPRGL
jgi:hypothetical protein